MQTFKFPVVVCACALGFAVTIRAADNADQAAARAAVLAQMAQLDAATPPPTNVVTPAPVVKPAPVAPIIKPVVVAPVAPQPAPVVVSAAGDNADQAAARAAVRRKLNELEQQSPTPPSAPVQSVAPVVVVPVKAATPAPAPTPAPVIVTTPAPVPAAVNANAAFHPIPAPALPISGSKAERLQALDAQYKSGLITPQDYFTQREALLNGQ